MRDIELPNAGPALDPDFDMVFSLGGDSTVVHASRCIANSKIPLVGVSSDPTRKAGQLMAYSVLGNE